MKPFDIWCMRTNGGNEDVLYNLYTDDGYIAQDVYGCADGDKAVALDMDPDAKPVLFEGREFWVIDSTLLTPCSGVSR